MQKISGFIYLGLAIIGAVVAARRIVPAVIAEVKSANRTEQVIETKAGLPGTRDANFASTEDFERNHLKTFGAVREGGATPYNYGMI